MLNETQIQKIRKEARKNGVTFAWENPTEEVKRNECGDWTDALLSAVTAKDLANQFGVNLNEDCEWSEDDWSQFLEIYEAECHSAWEEAFYAK